MSQESAVLRKKSYLYAVGRRKSAVARVRLYVDKQSEITVNERSAAQYFHNFYLEKIVSDPLRATELLGKVGLSIKVSGGGPRGQAESIRHGIARVLTSWQKEFRAPLKQAGFLRRDPRVKERKKYGLKRARRAPQWSKR
ncbi:MAG: 30S ribosomal protein S9 [Candidatus Kerfeldbacteria bacterium RIFCSPHIGHO2_02_FULL_42_14]|uniref:Small ribosomal subunit protein uS9 n=1 Tax=Candidatus Kerfeldbacteria bacterium RIFCSPHIGHO2_02_FULL_42_14 TaxID=1798540 RepID=A0A1G2AQZ4_9BACT|nr:MAG: 30S ribosomal protein S9 [Candidatus Kerfeldbacteria bacterium RIFCSPHIGHO2_02_FULL_42_14]OGY80707.1 MAG: 30S ribosomal protein S9 [Candidatus Kerfeldbacteria bacterium RIFCSPHIGHO2_12_FULL_42_13]OGY82634.1 MAG: 30S ribosomal protein S9 [Candidatus Kerfeldbacteria bacterium RIFCSPLOWO2_02_FULL_42_19]OGY85237.1 MAG: 30S ribosomal protein S9 [Candidatus Kerfeldbacteria bacterium RIFCSPLOWO2_12_FULL_43_9]